ncbi:SDR family oxidoreductase [Streptomyces sp. URMC 123]|uniref:SDR family oxidoreductase n=1 Tax=Streptomyces sp. URMC 123 TaxID=3423403 RepID=UPI003F1BAA89
MAHRVLRGRTVVVTGAARGVGELLARKLAARGARLALVGLEPERLGALSEQLPTDSAHWYADVTDAEAMAAVAEAVAGHFGRVDAVVANAGVATGGPFTDSDAASWNRVVEVNLLGSVTTARSFLPALLASRGYLLQIASLAAIAPSPLMTAYCASKAGVEAFAHSLRTEVGHRGVRVGVGYLSWTDTDMVRGADEHDVMRELRGRLPWPANRTYPLGPAVDRLADGIERRAAHVYGQWWLRGMQPLRGALPSLIALGSGRELRRVEPLLAAGPRTWGGLVGAGGAADERARRGAADERVPGGAAGERAREGTPS